MPLLRDEGQRWRDLEHEERAELFGCLRDVLPVEGHHVGCRVELEEDRPAHDVADGVQTELERRDDAEVAAPAPERPEEVVVLVLAGPEQRAIHLAVDGDVPDVQAKEPLGDLPQEAAEQRAGQGGARTDAATRQVAIAEVEHRRGQPEGVGRVVEVAPQRSSAGTSDARGRVDLDVAHARQVDDEAVVDGAEAGDAVASAAHGEVEPLVVCCLDRRDDVGGVSALHDCPRASIVHPVVDLAGLVVARSTRFEDLTADSVLQALDVRAHDSPLVS